MDNPMQAVIDRNLAAVARKDVEAAVAGFAPDGVLIDPHYPLDRMEGHESLTAGFRWVFDNMRELNFEVRHYFFGDGRTAAAEVDSHHILANGRAIDFSQTFVVEARGELVTRWQAYEPYGPHGIGGFFLNLSKRSFRRKH